MSSDSSVGLKKTEGDKKRKNESSSSSCSSGDEGARKRRKEKKRRRKDGSSDDERKRRKEKKKARKLRRKMKKKLKEKERAKRKDVERPTVKQEEEEEEEASAEIPISLMSKTMAPMTKEQWEKEQSVVRKVYDESTGRHRLIKGDGEVIEEMVSRDRHKAINEQATRGDGNFFQKNVLSKR